MTVELNDVKIAVKKVIIGMLPEITSAIAAQLTTDNVEKNVPKTFGDYWVNKQNNRYYVLMDGFTTIYIGKEWNTDKATKLIELRKRQVNIKVWSPSATNDCDVIVVSRHKECS